MTITIVAPDSLGAILQPFWLGLAKVDSGRPIDFEMDDLGVTVFYYPKTETDQDCKEIFQ